MQAVHDPKYSMNACSRAPLSLLVSVLCTDASFQSVDAARVMVSIVTLKTTQEELDADWAIPCDGLAESMILQSRYEICGDHEWNNTLMICT